MRTCIRCGHAISEHTVNCPSCGANQGLAKRPPQEHDDTFLKVLCILTIIGASIGLLSAAFTWGAVSGAPDVIRAVQLLGILAAIGKMTGAILMLQKRITGLYIYTAAAIANLLLTAATVFYLDMLPKDPAVPQAIMTFSVILGLSFSASFVVMYWLPINRRHLS
ncbi:hypothetical protein [uncultured Flavobacterium sp.]|uniref:hypothetical protein n=1 Tax=uncultured Flavobacterium sp. TaxID=165435 RepID=UPI0025F029BD|nr:hypothetical protein [uncultured Flavobacterium sp.]